MKKVLVCGILLASSLSSYEIVIDETLKLSPFSRDDSKEVVIDTKRKLMWQDDESVKNVQKDWQGAISLCKNLKFAGFDDWGLPSRMELLSITDKTKYNPAIQGGFKNVVSGHYWSSSPYVSDSSYVWVVDFDYGYGHGYDGKRGSSYVRCVRNSK